MHMHIHYKCHPQAMLHSAGVRPFACSFAYSFARCQLYTSVTAWSGESAWTRVHERVKCRSACIHEGRYFICAIFTVTSVVGCGGCVATYVLLCTYVGVNLSQYVRLKKDGGV